MTKKDFIYLAQRLKIIKGKISKKDYEIVLNEIIIMCSRSNPRFNKDIFIKAIEK